MMFTSNENFLTEDTNETHFRQIKVEMLLVKNVWLCITKVSRSNKKITAAQL